ncbi:hypothetical protein JXA34_01950 [Patescibacteria group bacterium]|nr:hypothetical protein [Patescibacteria group bacterium]
MYLITSGDFMDQLIETIETYVKKVPPLPNNIKEVIVKFAPWLAILSVVFSLPALLSLLGLNSYFNYMGISRYMYHSLGTGYMAKYYIAQAFLVANLVLVGLSIPGLFSKSKSGWMFLFYSILVYGVHSLFTANIVGGLLGLVISLYFLFQVKSYYTKEAPTGSQEGTTAKKSVSEKN